MRLDKKVIYILSPQPWSNFHVSKHNYAIELAKRQNEVYFISRGQGWDAAISLNKLEAEGLHKLSYNSILSKRIRFHFPKLYAFLHNIQLHRIMKRIGKKADIVWCFDPLIYPNLKRFNAELAIFHPVDLMESEFLVSTPMSADVIFSVADNILSKFKHLDVPSYLVNHGLSSHFSDNELVPYKKSEKLSFAYIGNICMHGIDHSSLKSIIEKHFDIEFHFYGPTETDKRISKESVEFIQFLSKSENVILHGIVEPLKLVSELSRFDGYLLCYLPNEQINKGSNSHKILEYLSFGRLIVSSLITFYKGREEISMSERMDNSDYVELFDNCVRNIEELNSEANMQKRRELALNNTYAMQIEQIESHLSKLYQK